jgi:hypothetical protein
MSPTVLNEHVCARRVTPSVLKLPSLFFLVRFDNSSYLFIFTKIFFIIFMTK